MNFIATFFSVGVLNYSDDKFMNAIAVGNVCVEPGTKQFGYLRVEQAATLRTFMYNTQCGPPRPRAVLIPVMILNGSIPGPILCLTAGTHACEYVGIESEIRIYQDTDPETLKGTLIIVPVVNPASFWTRTPYVNVQDGVDIAYAYGRQGSTISYVIANTLLNSVYAKADFLVDIHGGDLLEEYYPNSEFVKTGNRNIDRQSELLARTFGTEVIREHTLPVDDPKIGKFALHIPQVAVEIGCCGRLDEASVSIAVRGISNIMKHLDMIEGEPVLPKKQTLWHSGAYVYVEKAGLFYPKVQVGDKINQGQILGVIKNLQGQLIEELVAPHDGMVTLMMHNPVKLPGDLVFKCLKP